MRDTEIIAISLITEDVERSDFRDMQCLISYITMLPFLFKSLNSKFDCLKGESGKKET